MAISRKPQKNKASTRSSGRKQPSRPRPNGQAAAERKVGARKKAQPAPTDHFPGGVFPIVGMGASAGGLEALEEFFTHMQADSGMAFIVVTHLHPKQTSLLPELVQKCTRMEVCEAADGAQIVPNRVYVCPPNQELAILQGTLRLTESPARLGLRLPIDCLFRSLAVERRDKAICIVLSGTGTDGTLGLKAVKGESGMAMVQDPDSAKFAGMPSSAIATGMVDYVLRAAEMPGQLLRYARGPYLTTSLLLPAAGQPHSESLQKIFLLLRERTGHDFSLYKANAIRRRIERRMNVHHIQAPRDYIRYLRENPNEIDLLFKELLIGVTTFFRDPEAFEALRRKALPKLLSSIPDNSTVRVWVPGCSTGEEAYSIAIILTECMHDLDRHLNVQIFGTDLDTHAINTARTGLYPNGIAADVGSERLGRYFVKEDNNYRIKKDIRDMVVFAPQNVIKDAPFTKLDLISCRNLLIYLDAELQKRLVPLFHYALRSSGFLLLGSSETVGGSTDLFSAVDKKWKLFTRTECGTTPLQFDGLPLAAAGGRPESSSAADVAGTAGRPMLLAQIDRMLLDKYVPPTVIIDEAGEIVFIHGRTGLYLEPPTGRPKLNIFNMAREGLRIALAAALRKAASAGTEVLQKGVQIKGDGGHTTVNLGVRRIAEPESVRGLYAVAFQAVGADEQAAESKSKRNPAKHRQGQATELEQELQYTKENLHATVEELETANEELKSTNEELQSTNEELQSANEELETSKEEMQSLNEELQTVNAELQGKIEDLSRANDDMRNLLNSMNVATVFLDGDLNIKRFTTQAKKVTNLIPTDVGRPISDIVSKFNYDRLVEDCRKVIRTLVFSENEVQTEDGSWYFMRIMPYRTSDNVIDGLVITFVDINGLKHIETGLRESEERHRAVLEAVADGIVTIDADGSIRSINAAAGRMFGYGTQDLVGENVAVLLPPPDSMRHQDYIAAYLRTGEAKIIGVGREVTGRRKDGTVFPLELTISELRVGRCHAFTGVMRDITDRKRAAQKDARAYTESIVETLSTPVAILDLHLHVTAATRAFEKLCDVGLGDLQGQIIYEVAGGLWDIPRLHELLNDVLPKTDTVTDFRVEHHLPKLGHRVLLVNARRFAGQGDRPGHVLLAIEDVTDDQSP